jgi:hypothetical protein
MKKIITSITVAGILFTGVSGVHAQSKSTTKVTQTKKAKKNKKTATAPVAPVMAYGSAEMEQKLIEVLNANFMKEGTALDPDRVEFLDRGIFINDMFEVGEIKPYIGRSTHCILSDKEGLEEAVEAVTGRDVTFSHSSGYTNHYFIFGGIAGEPIQVQKTIEEVTADKQALVDGISEELRKQGFDVYRNLSTYTWDWVRVYIKFPKGTTMIGEQMPKLYDLKYQNTEYKSHRVFWTTNDPATAEIDYMTVEYKIVGYQDVYYK